VRTSVTPPPLVAPTPVPWCGRSKKGRKKERKKEKEGKQSKKEKNNPKK
jgi:hypothetical protein